MGDGWAVDELPKEVCLPTQGGRRKPVLDHVSLEMPPSELRNYASESDVFLELVSRRCRQRGISTAFRGNPNAGETDESRSGDVAIYMENASTHTGTNVAFSIETLRSIFGADASP